MVDALETGDQGKEAGTKREPQNNHDDAGRNGFLTLQPRDCFIDEAPVQKPGVQEAVFIGGEEEREDDVAVARNSRCIEEQCHDGTDLRRHFVDQPCEAEAHQVADRTCNRREDDGVLDGGQEQVVDHEELVVVVDEYEAGRLNHIERRKAETDRHDNRNDRKCREDQGVRKEEEVICTGFLHLSELELEVLTDVLQRRILCWSRTGGFVDFSQGLVLLYLVI